MKTPNLPNTLLLLGFIFFSYSCSFDGLQEVSFEGQNLPHKSIDSNDAEWAEETADIISSVYHELQPAIDKEDFVITQEWYESLQKNSKVDHEALVNLNNQLLDKFDQAKSNGWTDEYIATLISPYLITAKRSDQAGTPCYDTFEQNIAVATAIFGTCTIAVVLTNGGAAIGLCMATYAIQAASAQAKYNNCMDNTYGNNP